LKSVAKGIGGKVRNSLLDANVRLNLDYMESTLQHLTGFCGEHLTRADVHMSFAVEVAEFRICLDIHNPKLAEFLERVRIRPAYKESFDKG